MTMKRTTIALLLAGLFVGVSTAALAQNVTAGDKPAESSQAAPAEQKEMTNPAETDSPAGMKKGKHSRGAAAFKKADKDNDGTLDREEAKAMPHVTKDFDAIDADKDGTVSLEEIHSFMKAAHKASN
jgi:hypothetical protein